MTHALVSTKSSSFVKLTGETLELTRQWCLDHAQEFDWSWGAANFLSPAALAEYERVRAAAWAEYNRVGAAAWAECERVRAAVWAAVSAEYDRVEATAEAEYERVRAPAWAEVRAREGGNVEAEYERVRAAAFADAYIGDA